MLLTTMTTSSSAVGSLSPSRIMQAADASPPTSACPSAPMFQKRMRKAGVTASARQSRIAMFWQSPQMRRLVPKAPSHIVL